MTMHDLKNDTTHSLELNAKLMTKKAYGKKSVFDIHNLHHCIKSRVHSFHLFPYLIKYV